MRVVYPDRADDTGDWLFDGHLPLPSPRAGAGDGTQWCSSHSRPASSDDAHGIDPGRVDTIELSVVAPVGILRSFGVGLKQLSSIPSFERVPVAAPERTRLASQRLDASDRGSWCTSGDQHGPWLYGRDCLLFCHQMVFSPERTMLGEYTFLCLNAVE